MDCRTPETPRHEQAGLMPILKNARHERYCQELAKGKTSDEAYQLAGFSANRGNATRLKAKESVQSRLIELQARVAAKAEVTVDSLIIEVEEARLLAMSIKQPSAAVAATREKGVLSGKRIERTEVGAPGEFDGLTADELRDQLRSEAAAIGEGTIASSLAGGSGAARGKPH